jgi:hypothetical protein
MRPLLLSRAAGGRTARLYGIAATARQLGARRPTAAAPDTSRVGQPQTPARPDNSPADVRKRTEPGRAPSRWHVLNVVTAALESACRAVGCTRPRTDRGAIAHHRFLWAIAGIFGRWRARRRANLAARVCDGQLDRKGRRLEEAAARREIGCDPVPVRAGKRGGASRADQARRGGCPFAVEIRVG